MNKLYFESAPHSHLGRLTNRELALHLTMPHLTRKGHISVAPPVSAILKWSRQEMERTHAEFHDQG